MPKEQPHPLQIILRFVVYTNILFKHGAGKMLCHLELKQPLEQHCLATTKSLLD